MIRNGEKTIIGIDHGYGYIKTAKTVMKSGVEEQMILPPFTEDIIETDSGIYVVGQTRTDHPEDKTANMDYYILTLAAVAKEMDKSNLKRLNNITIAAGLPYSFFTAQKDSFRRYLLKNKNVNFKFEGKKYSIGIKDVKLIPQGFPIVSSEISDHDGKEKIVVDIGSRTIDVLCFINGKPIYDKCFSIDRRGTLDCVDSIKKSYLATYQENVDEELIHNIMRGEETYLDTDKVRFIEKLIRMYTDGIIRELKSKGVYHSIVFSGGGACVIKNFGTDISDTSVIKNDINANAKGYEKLAAGMIK